MDCSHETFLIDAKVISNTDCLKERGKSDLREHWGTNKIAKIDTVRICLSG
jgi:hypothetical protein